MGTGVGALPRALVGDEEAAWGLGLWVTLSILPTHCLLPASQGLLLTPATWSHPTARHGHGTQPPRTAFTQDAATPTAAPSPARSLLLSCRVLLRPPLDTGPCHSSATSSTCPAPGLDGHHTPFPRRASVPSVSLTLQPGQGHCASLPPHPAGWQPQCPPGAAASPCHSFPRRADQDLPPGQQVPSSGPCQTSSAVSHPCPRALFIPQTLPHASSSARNAPTRSQLPTPLPPSP